MAQARVLEPETTPHSQTLVSLGFRWCKKDQRWEKNTKDPNKVLQEVVKVVPNVRTEAKTP